MEPPLRRRDGPGDGRRRGDGRAPGWWFGAGMPPRLPEEASGPPGDPPPPPWSIPGLTEPKVNCGAGLPGVAARGRRVVAARGVGDQGNPDARSGDAAGEVEEPFGPARDDGRFSIFC